jgi:hypothetical protein
MSTKNKSLRIGLIILAGFVFVAIFTTMVFVYNLKDGLFYKPQHIVEPTADQRTNFDPGSVVELVFQFNKNQNKLHLTRGADQAWDFSDLPQADLPQEEIESAIQLSITLSALAEVVSPYDEAELGFKPPIAKLILTMSDGTTRLIEIGKVNQDQGLYNVRVDSGKPFLADFQTVYSILKIFYLKVLPVAMNDGTPVAPMLTPGK